MFVKICGLSTSEAVETSVAAGANALGFVFAPSPRQVSPDLAHALCRNVRDDIIRVAVMHHPTVEEWTRVRTVFAPDWLQTDTEDFDELDLEDCEPLPVFRTRLNPSGDKWPARMLFESPRSGSGEKANWQEAAWMAMKTRVILAGGLNSRYIVTAVQSVKPWGVDVSSGVESARGIKDQKKITRFLSRVRSMENNDGAR